MLGTDLGGTPYRNFGAFSIDPGTSGTAYFDAFESRRSSYIGPLALNPPPVAANPLPFRGGQGRGHFASYTLPRPQQQSVSFSATFVYDGDGKRVKSTIAGVTTYFAGTHYEVTGSTITKYYYAGSQRIAMRTGTTLSYLLADHLGSTSLTTNASGQVVSELRYKAWGETRYSSGTTPTKYQFTGQYSYVQDFGLHFYNARWYDSYITQFSQPDTIVPDPNNSQDWDRYAYARNNPVRYVDPSGHSTECTWDSACTYGQRLSPETVAKKYNVTFGGNWTEEHKWAVVHGVIRTAYRFAEELRTKATDAFKSAYGLNDGDTFFFEWDENCWGCRADPIGCDAGTTNGDACISAFGFTNTENHIEFASMSDVEVPLRNINNVIHELGHAFNLRLGRGPENALAVRGDLLVNGAGFYGYAGNITWEQSTGINGTETFADQFLGWVYGKWGADPLGPVRADFMTQMNGTTGWVAQASTLP